MKKQFFYAAMAVALMASCTSEDSLVVDPITPDADDKVAIELGVDAPTVSTTVGGRSVGSVGDIADAQNTAPENRKNVWNGEQLYIAMVDKATGNLATEKVNGTENVANVLDHTNYVYYAPRRSENSNSGTIRMYKEANKPATNNGDGTRSYVYYPVSGQYDFYGWHLDDAGKTVDAEGEPTVVAPTVTITKDAKTVKNIIINGQQDIMGAKTKEFTEANYFGQGSGVTATYADMVGWDFSARTARNKINPILKFEHQLARLKFFVKAGSDKTATQYWNGNAWVENKIETAAADGETPAQYKSTAMEVKSIKVLKMIDVIDMNLEGTDANGKPAVVTTSTDTESATFTLGSRGNDGIMTDLVATAPKYYVGGASGTPTYAENDPDKDGSQVGESVMFFPGENSSKTVELEVELSQYVQVLDDETSDEYDAAEWTTKTQKTTLKVHASSLINQTEGAAKAFEPGKSYNVYITVYGFERIEITAELTAWELGGDVNVDVEEGESRHENAVVNFILKDTEGNAITEGATITAPYTYKDNAGVTQSGTAVFEAGDEAGTYTAKVHSFAVLNYNIEVDGYEPARGLVNARNGQDVTITMKATTPAQGGEEAEPFDVTFGFFTLEMTPVEIADEDITIISPENCTVVNGKVTVPAGTTEIIYSIAETELYEAISDSHATVSAEYPSVHVTMTPRAQEPEEETYTLSFNVSPAGQTTITIFVNGEEIDGNSYEAVPGTEITYEVKDNEGRTTGEQTYRFGEADDEIVINMEDYTPSEG